MNEAYQTVITASDEERRDLFLGTAARLGTAVQNVEKDFWVCWTLDALFNGLEPGGPRLLFKGGTSLSKAFGLISRFSEDIDITVFREDLHQDVDVAELEAMSGKKRRARLDEIRDACRAYIDGPFFSQLQARAAASIPDGRFRLERDHDDPDGQSLLLWYPAVTARENDYIRSAVKIESGAKSALDPHTPATVRPYVDDDLPGQELEVSNVVTVKPERIRHRVAHFRSLHRDDLARVTQFLRDIDSGFWRFCTSYNDPRPVLPQSNDPVVEHFLGFDLLPWGETGAGK